MNPLTHAYFALELFKEEKLTQDEKDHLIVGSILPDIHVSGLIQCQKTHGFGMEFFRSASNPFHKLLALGMISHGEEPKGLDHYTHNEGGYILQKQKHVIPLAKKYRKHIGKIDPMTIHYLIEFSVDNLIVEKDPSIIPQVLAAFQNPKIESAITAFSRFFGFSERKNLKIMSLLRNRHLLNYFRNFSSPETTSRNWLNLTFYRNLKKGKNLPFREKIKRFSRFSFYNLKRKISNKRITRLFRELNSHLRKDALEFISETRKKLTSLKNELIKEFRS